MDDTTQATDTITITFSLQTNKVGSRCTTDVEVDADEWAEMTQAERNAYAKDIFWADALGRLGEWDWEAG